MNSRAPDRPHRQIRSYVLRAGRTTPGQQRALDELLPRFGVPDGEHAVDFEAAGLGELGRPEGYVRRQVDGWAGRYETARDAAARWLNHLREERRRGAS